MALEKVTRGTVNRASKVILYGVEKIGKTTLLSKLDNVLFIDTEHGTDLLDVARYNVKSIDELYQILNELATTNHDIKNVAIDSIDFAEDLLKEKVKKDNKWSSLEQPGFGKGFNILREEFEILLFKLDEVIRKGINVILVGHSTIKAFTPPESAESYSRYELKLDRENSVKAKSWADAILFANYKTSVMQGTDNKQHAIGGSERVLYATRTAAYDAGNRFGLPDKLKMDIKSLDPIFGTSTIPHGVVTSSKAEPLVKTMREAQVSAEAVQLARNGEKAAAELTAQSEKSDLPEIVGEFIEATGELDIDLLKKFLVNRGVITDSGSLMQVPEAYAKAAVERIKDFKSAVANFGKQNA